MVSQPETDINASCLGGLPAEREVKDLEKKVPVSPNWWDGAEKKARREVRQTRKTFWGKTQQKEHC